MNRMKLLLCTAAIAAAAFIATPEVRADELAKSTPTRLLTGGTNKVVALSTNGFYSIDVPRAKDIALFCDYKYLNAPGAGDVNGLRIDIWRGIESGIYETNIWATWNIAAGSSTTANSQITNFTLPSVGYLRFKIANVSTNSHATNLTFTYSFKN